MSRQTCFRCGIRADTEKVGRHRYCRGCASVMRKLAAKGHLKK